MWVLLYIGHVMGPQYKLLSRCFPLVHELVSRELIEKKVNVYSQNVSSLLLQTWYIGPVE